jgi:hypothetical protein
MTALSLAPPPAPNPTPQDTSSAFPSALATQPMGAQAQSPQPPQGQTPSPPSHAQTVAAVRHFDMVAKEIEGLLKDPDCGKTDIRSAAIDAITRLVGEGVTSPADAVQQLGNFPDRPFDQKKALENMLAQVDHAATIVLAHHQMAFAGQDLNHPAYNPDNHIELMQGLTKQYGGGNNPRP